MKGKILFQFKRKSDKENKNQVDKKDNTEIQNQLDKKKYRVKDNKVILNICDEKTIYIIYKTIDDVKYTKAVIEGEFFSQDYCQSLIQRIDRFIIDNDLPPKYLLDVVLPDSLMFSDIVYVPIMKRKSIKDMLNITLVSLYKNRSDLTINDWVLAKNKEQVVFFITGIQTQFLKEIKYAFSNIKQNISLITFYSSTQISWLNNTVGLSNGLVAFLNLKQENSNLCFKYRNFYVGSTDIPFGYNILNKEVKDFNELFTHEIANSLLTKLGKMKEDGLVEKPKKSKKTKDEVKEKSVEKVTVTTDIVVDRPYNNFTIFVKIVLDYIKENFDYKIFGVPLNVYVSMPKDFIPLLDKVNADEEENGVRFSYVANIENEKIGNKIVNQLYRYNLNNSKIGPQSL